MTDVAAPPAVQLDIHRGFEAMVEIIDLDGTTHQEYFEIAPNWGEVTAGFSVPVFEKAKELYPSLIQKMHLLSVLQQNEEGDYTVDHLWDPPLCPTWHRDNPDHWIKKDEERKKFWPESNELAKSLGIKAGKPQRDWVHQVLGCDRMEDFAGSRADAMKLLAAAVQAQTTKTKPADAPGKPTNENSNSAVKELKEQIGKQYAWLSPNAKPGELKAWFKDDSGGHANVDEALKHMSGDLLFEMIAKAVKARKEATNGNSQPPATNNAPAEPPPAEPPPIEEDEQPVDPPSAETVAEMPTFTVKIEMPSVASYRTMTGVPVTEIEQRLDTKYPIEAYTVIKMKGGRAGTDISYDYVRDRFVEVFGIQGIGWRFTIHPSGGVLCQRETDKGTKYHVSLMAHVFEYRIVNGEQSEWIQLAPMSDGHVDDDEGYAYRGAETSLLKHVLRSMGGFNHLYRYEKLHAWATRELAKKAR